MFDDILYWVIISDLHCGCQFGLCPPRIKLDGCGEYRHSLTTQKFIWECWKTFWNKWVPFVCKNPRTGNPEPFGVIINGDAMEGRHHHAITQISQNLADQVKIAQACLAPVVEKCNGRMYLLRGTEAHSGASGEMEEILGQRLGVIKDKGGNYARNDLWKRIGSGLIHVMHHVGVTSTSAYESTAICKEFVETLAESAKWRYPVPNIVIRSHRHRYVRVGLPTGKGEGYALITPGWQAKTPFAWKKVGTKPPQFGGAIVAQGIQELYAIAKVWSVKTTEIV